MMECAVVLELAGDGLGEAEEMRSPEDASYFISVLGHANEVVASPCGEVHMRSIWKNRSC